MRWVAHLVAAATFLATSTGAFAAEVQVDEFIARAGPEQVTESNVAIEGGVIYRMEVSGTISVTDHGVTATSDAAWCFMSSAGGCNPPSQNLSDNIGFAVGKSYPGIGGLESFADFPYDGYRVPPYDEGHSYELRFRSEINGKGKLYVVTHPIKDDNPGLSGSFTIRLFTEQAAMPDPQPTSSGGSRFGVPSTFVAPVPGSGVLLTSPALPRGLRQLKAAVGLAGAAPGRTFGVARLRITDGRTLAAMCAFWGNIAVPAAQISLPKQYATTAEQNSGIFNACAQTLLHRVNGTAARTSSCRPTVVPVAVAGARLTARQRRAATSFVKHNLRSSCTSSGAGGLGLRLRARTRRATMRALLGPRMSLGVVRARTARPDGASPTLSARWSR